MTNLTLPEEELLFEKEAETAPNLGPTYFAARAISERFMKHFEAEHFEPLIKHFADKLRDKVWEDFSSWLLSDTESNLQCEIRYRVDRSVEALLEGKPSYIKQYVMGQYGDVEIREAVARHISEELQDQRVLDLEEQVKQLKESLKFAQERNSY